MIAQAGHPAGRGTEAGTASVPAPRGAPAPVSLATELLDFVEDAARALAVPDAEREQERAVLAEHYGAEPSADPYRPSDPDPLRDGLVVGAVMRLPAWERATPPRAAWCSVCGRSDP
jgi:hypothetical protein